MISSHTSSTCQPPSPLLTLLLPPPPSLLYCHYHGHCPLLLFPFLGGGLMPCVDERTWRPTVPRCANCLIGYPCRPHPHLLNTPPLTCTPTSYPHPSLPHLHPHLTFNPTLPTSQSHHPTFYPTLTPPFTRTVSTISADMLA